MVENKEGKRSVLIRSLVAIIAVGLLLSCFNLLASYTISNREGRKMCALIVTLDNTYRANPPTTTTGQEVAANVHKLRMDLGCPDGPAKVSSK